MATTAKQGDVFRLELETHYDEHGSPMTVPRKYILNLTVVRVTGKGPDDLVLFDDHTHTKQKHIPDFQKIW